MAEMDPMELCPLDPAHQIRRSRMQFHLVRCMKNHTLEDKVVCPYNSVHIVDKINFQVGSCYLYVFVGLFHSIFCNSIEIGFCCCDWILRRLRLHGFKSI